MRTHGKWQKLTWKFMGLMQILENIMRILFFNDLHKFLKADFIMANPPFNLSNWGHDKLKDGICQIHHLAPNGKIGLVLANGALSTQTSGEGEIRKNII